MEFFWHYTTDPWWSIKRTNEDTVNTAPQFHTQSPPTAPKHGGPQKMSTISTELSASTQWETTWHHIFTICNLKKKRNLLSNYVYIFEVSKSLSDHQGIVSHLGSMTMHDESFLGRHPFWWNQKMKEFQPWCDQSPEHGWEWYKCPHHPPPTIAFKH